MLYLNRSQFYYQEQLSHLTLTNVVFESATRQNVYKLIWYLTLTNVVFEFLIEKKRLF